MIRKTPTKKTDEIMTRLRELEVSNTKLKDMYSIISSEFGIQVHKRTIENWRNDIRFEKQLAKDKIYMAHCVEEYTTPIIKTEDELLLDEMFNQYQKLGASN